MRNILVCFRLYNIRTANRFCIPVQMVRCANGFVSVLASYTYIYIYILRWSVVFDILCVVVWLLRMTLKQASYDSH